jgi:hypothetical protein
MDTEDAKDSGWSACKVRENGELKRELEQEDGDTNFLSQPEV